MDYPYIYHICCQDGPPYPVVSQFLCSFLIFLGERWESPFGMPGSTPIRSRVLDFGRRRRRPTNRWWLPGSRDGSRPTRPPNDLRERQKSCVRWELQLYQTVVFSMKKKTIELPCLVNFRINQPLTNHRIASLPHHGRRCQRWAPTWQHLGRCRGRRNVTPVVNFEPCPGMIQLIDIQKWDG